MNDLIDALRRGRAAGIPSGATRWSRASVPRVGSAKPATGSVIATT
jgi:hypothetical protein